MTPGLSHIQTVIPRAGLARGIPLRCGNEREIPHFADAVRNDLLDVQGNKDILAMT